MYLNNEEKYISFSKSILVNTYTNKKGEIVNVMEEIRFLDTLAFMPSSLQKLAENLASGNNDIQNLRKTFKNVSNHFINDNPFKLMITKGIYPYDYVTSYNVLKETMLPCIDKFNSKLNNSSCSVEDYQKAINVWNEF